MSNRIYLTQKDIDEAVEKYKQQLSMIRSADGKFDFTPKGVFCNKKEKANLFFSPEAYTKIYTLVDGYTTEVAWHGLVKRINDNSWLVYDIIIYPHETNAATVPADDSEYTNWWGSLPSEQFDFLHFHGHSHASMGTTPSSTDMDYRKNILMSFPKIEGADMFYIFAIFNKSRSCTASIYDYTNNIAYDTGDITVSIAFDSECKNTDGTFLKECKKVAHASERVPTCGYQGRDGYYDDDYYYDYGYGSSYGANIGDKKGVHGKTSPFEGKEKPNKAVGFIDLSKISWGKKK